jgi:glutamate-1-semialdehyde 2,1-aminomutase
MPVSSLSVIDPRRLKQLQEQEHERFVADRPRSMAYTERARRAMPRGVPMSWMDDLYDHPPVWISHGQGSKFTDVDGHTYLDMYIADMSAFCGHAPVAVTEAVAQRMARGGQFLLPSEDAIPLAEHLVARYGMPKWQFTLSATQANMEVIRLARHATGREVVLLFDAKYLGHADATLVALDDGHVVPEYDGLLPSIAKQARVVAFNDEDALGRALAPGDVALVLTEPAMTNAGLIQPKDGFLEHLRRVTRETGTLLAIDETHTLVCSYGGLTRLWNLQPDLLTIGKSIAAGVPLGAYGMTDAVAAHMFSPDERNVVSGAIVSEVATGGTLFANPASLVAGLTALTQILTEEAFERTAELGNRLAEGLRASIERWSVPWSVTHLGGHACYFFEPAPPVDGASSRDADDPDLRALIRTFMANRGVWESGWWLGPTVSVAHSPDNVRRYLQVFDTFLEATVGADRA